MIIKFCVIFSFYRNGCYSLIFIRKLLVDKKDQKQQCQYPLANYEQWSVREVLWRIKVDEGLFRKSTRAFATFVCMFFVSVCKWVASVCLKNCHVQILLLAWHSYKVHINPQQIFSEKSRKSIEIHCLSWDHCDYWLLSTNITNQSTIMLLTKIRALSTYRLAFRWLILIDM